MQFWAEALAALIYVWNCCPSAALNGKTPMRCGSNRNLMCLISEFGDVWPMSIYKRINTRVSVHTWRKAYL